MAIKVSPGLEHKFSDVHSAQLRLKSFVEKGSSFTGRQREEIVLIYEIVLRHLVAFERFIEDNEK